MSDILTPHIDFLIDSGESQIPHQLLNYIKETNIDKKNDYIRKLSQAGFRQDLFAVIDVDLQKYEKIITQKYFNSSRIGTYDETTFSKVNVLGENVIFATQHNGYDCGCLAIINGLETLSAINHINIRTFHFDKTSSELRAELRNTINTRTGKPYEYYSQRDVMLDGGVITDYVQQHYGEKLELLSSKKQGNVYIPLTVEDKAYVLDNADLLIRHMPEYQHFIAVVKNSADSFVLLDSLKSGPQLKTRYEVVQLLGNQYLRSREKAFRLT